MHFKWEIIFPTDPDLKQGDDNDFDFNDMIFTVSDNRENLETVSFEMKDIVVL